MSRFDVRYSPRSRQELQISYDWGVENWGREQAENWLKQIGELIRKRLSFMPVACPLEPENSDFEFELRQLVVHRYRILFRIFENTVFVLRVRGPFSGELPNLE